MRILQVLMALGFVFALLPTGLAEANNAGSNRQSCKKGHVWHYQMAKCIPKPAKKFKNRIVFTE